MRLAIALLLLGMALATTAVLVRAHLQVSGWLSPEPPGHRCIVRLLFGWKVERMWGSSQWGRVRGWQGNHHALSLGLLVFHREVEE